MSLPPKPLFVYRTSFTSKNHPNDLLNSLVQCFGEHTEQTLDVTVVHHECSQDKKKIKGVGYDYSNYMTYVFRIRLYQGDVKGEILCEFHKLSGCIVSFEKFYRRTLQLVSSHVAGGVNNIEAPKFVKSHTQLIDETVTLLFAMVGCENVDFQQDCAQGLADAVASSTCNQNKLAKMYHRSDPTQPNIVQVIMKLLRSREEKLQWYGSVILLHMSSCEDMKEILVFHTEVLMTDIMSSPYSLHTIEVKNNLTKVQGRLFGIQEAPLLTRQNACTQEDWATLLSTDDSVKRKKRKKDEVKNNLKTMQDRLVGVQEPPLLTRQNACTQEDWATLLSTDDSVERKKRKKDEFKKEGNTDEETKAF